MFFIAQISYSQTHIYKHFGVDDGLPSSEVYDIYQDKQGYVWFATDKGLSRYNGYEFKNFTTKDGLPDNTILDFFPQDNGQVWCYGYHSQRLFYFNEVFDGFKLYEHNDILKKEFGTKTILKCVVKDDNETLFLGGHNLNGFVKVNEEGLVKKYYDSLSYKTSSETIKGVNLGLKDKTFFYVDHDYKSEKDVFFLNTKNGVSSRLDVIFLNENNTILIDKKLGILSNNKEFSYFETEQNPIGIRKINGNSFFVGYYSNGAEIRDTSGNVIDTFLPNKSVSNFLIDAEGSYWFTTLDDGVFYIKNPNIKVFIEDHIASLVKDNTNTLYAGFNNGNIARITKKKIELLYKGLSTDNAIVEFNKDDNILYGYSDFYLKDYTNKSKSLFLSANKLPEYIKQTTLASTTSAFYTLKNNSVYPYSLNYKIQDVCRYQDTTLIGTSSGLFIQNIDSIKPHQPLDILKLRIDDIDLNKKKNTIYMTTQGAGVIVYGDSIYNITKKDGLTNDIVSEIHIENDSTVWACSNTGLNRINFKSDNTYNVTTITKEDGLLSNDIDDIEIINDTVWVATKKGLCYFKKDVLKEKATSKINSLTLKEVSANNTLVDDENVKLKYNQNNIDFKLLAISHKNVDNIKYLYRLKEVDTSWTSTKSRNISFPSLSPGKYTFQARALALNTISEHQLEYSFQIQPPYWKSWWFYGLCTVFFSALVYIFFKIRVLTYNKAIITELMRLAIKRLKRKEQLYKFRSNGEDFKIPSYAIQYVKSHGNYLDIITSSKKYTIRCKIGDFVSTTPDALEYVRVHRSYIIRIDQVTSKGRNWVVITDEKIPVGETYLSELEKIQF